MPASLVIWLAALLSGGAALAYEICWSRALVVPLGNSSDATGIVLAGFMLGIAAGARLAGAAADRVRAPLRWYAAAEAVLALFALIAPRLIPALGALPAGPASLVRLSAAALLIVVPCLAMGASLPLLVRALTRLGGSMRSRIGVTYGLNTGGAALGAIVAGFWGIATYGVARCSAMAAGASLLAASLGLLASFARFANPSSDTVSASQPAGASSGDRYGAITATFLSGFAMLACEVIWARVLTFVFGHDTYAFAALLALVLVGLSVGGLAHRALARVDQRVLSGALLAAFSASVLLSFHVAASLVVRFGLDPFGLDATRGLATSIHLELVRELAYTPVLVVLPSLFAGALFPAACALHAGDSRLVGRSVGTVGLVNGIGSALGALAAAFGLMALAGIQHALVLIAWLCCVGACALLAAPALAATDARRKRTALLSAVAVAIPTLVETARMPAGLPRSMLLAAVGDHHQTLLYYEEARTGTVSVTSNRINGEKVLMMNAVNEVTTRQVHDESFKLLGHLALLLHPQPRRAVMICLGAGLSAGAASLHPIDRLDVIDLSSAVPHAARKFSVENHGVLDNPVFRLHVDDGRQYLLNSPGGYDVAIVDATHPKSVDSWILYTREFYQLLRSRLGEGGIAVQWLPLHGLSEREFKIIVGTFQAAFPDMTLWADVGFETYGQVGYAKLVGVKGGPLTIDVGGLEERLKRPAIHRDLEPYGIATPEELLNLFVAGPEAIRAWTAGLPVQTDDLPMVPYTTQYSSGRRMEPRLLLGVRTPVTPLLRNGSDPTLEERLEGAYEAQGLVMAGMPERAAQLHPELVRPKIYLRQRGTTLPYYEQLAALYEGEPDRTFEAATQLGALGHPEEAVALFDKALTSRPHDFRMRLNLALVLGGMGQFRKAVDLLTELRDEQPGSAIVLYDLGATLLSSGQPGAAIPHLRESLAWDPESLGAQQSLAEALLATGETERAEARLREIVRGNPWVEEAWELLGVAAWERGDREAAIDRLGRAIGLNPYRAGVRVRLGGAYRAAGRPEQAAEQYDAAMRLEPRLEAAVLGLAGVRLDERRYEQAAQWYWKAIDLDGDDANAAYGLGLALRGQGRDEEAVQAFCLAMRLDGRTQRASEELRRMGRKPADCGR